MKILRFTLLSDYKMLKKGLVVDFLTKTRVDKQADNSDLFELEEGFYYPYETVFIGKNSSGKTSMLRLLFFVARFLDEGRIHGSALLDETNLSFEVLFYEEGLVCKYRGSFRKNPDIGNGFLTIEDESLQQTTLKASHKKDLANIFFPKNATVEAKPGGDTSVVRKPTKRGVTILTDSIANSAENLSFLMDLFFSIYSPDAFNSVVHLFDDSVESIRPFSQSGEKSGFVFKRVNKPEIIVSFDYLLDVLSAGTIRGMYLFLASFLAFKAGGTIFIDEIERSFNRNLAENLILLYNDRALNMANATLVYTTHYAELLDGNGRSDNINVLHREGDSISIKNLHRDYDISANHLKSTYFNQNAFDNLLNYDRLMELRRAISK